MPNLSSEEIDGCLQLATTIIDQVEHENATAKRNTGRNFSPLHFFLIGEVAITHILAYFFA